MSIKILSKPTFVPCKCPNCKRPLRGPQAGVPYKCPYCQTRFVVQR